MQPDPRSDSIVTSRLFPAATVARAQSLRAPARLRRRSLPARVRRSYRAEGSTGDRRSPFPLVEPKLLLDARVVEAFLAVEGAQAFTLRALVKGDHANPYFSISTPSPPHPGKDRDTGIIVSTITMVKSALWLAAILGFLAVDPAAAWATLLARADQPWGAGTNDSRRWHTRVCATDPVTTHALFFHRESPSIDEPVLSM